jgi:hypothetical protein
LHLDETASINEAGGMKTLNWTWLSIEECEPGPGGVVKHTYSFKHTLLTGPDNPMMRGAPTQLTRPRPLRSGPWQLGWCTSHHGVFGSGQ